MPGFYARGPPLPFSVFPAAEVHQCDRPHTSRPRGGAEEIKPQAQGRAPLCGRGAACGVPGRGPLCPPGSPCAPAMPLGLPTVRQERGQTQVNPEKIRTVLNVANHSLLTFSVNLTKFIYSTRNFPGQDIQGRGGGGCMWWAVGGAESRHRLGFHPSSSRQ